MIACKEYTESVNERTCLVLGEMPYTRNLPNRFTDEKINEIWELIQNSPFPIKKIGVLKGEQIVKVGTSDVRLYAMVKNNEPTFVLSLDQDLPFHTLGAWRIAAVAKKGSENFLSDFYKFLIVKEKITLISGNTQTEKAKKAWSILLKDKSVKTRLIDATTGEDFLGPVWDSNSLILLKKK